MINNIILFIIIILLIKEKACNESKNNTNNSTKVVVQNKSLIELKEYIINSLVFSHGILNKESEEDLKNRIRAINATNEKELRLQVMREINKSRKIQKQTNEKDIIDIHFKFFVVEVFRQGSKDTLERFNEIIEKPLITVVSLIYNGEKYLYRNLYMLQKQTLKQIQIIYIDDCSTDNSRQILEELAQIDSRITVIYNEKNMGIFASKMKLIEYIKADYAAIFDMDDIYTRVDALEKMYNDMNKYKVDYIEYYNLRGSNGRNFNKESHFSVYLNYNLNEYEIQILNSYIMVWLKVFRTNMLKKIINKITPEEKQYYITNYEDISFHSLVKNVSKSARYIDEPMIYYNFHSDSVSNIHTARFKDNKYRLYSIKVGKGYVHSSFISYKYSLNSVEFKNLFNQIIDYMVHGFNIHEIKNSDLFDARQTFLELCFKLKNSQYLNPNNHKNLNGFCNGIKKHKLRKFNNFSKFYL